MGLKEDGEYLPQLKHKGKYFVPPQEFETQTFQLAALKFEF